MEKNPEKSAAENPLFSVVIPVFNEQGNIAELHRRLSKTFIDRLSPDYEIIFVDDGSKDASWDAITRANHMDDRVVGIKFSRNFGQHKAIRAGFERARGEKIILMDSDLQDRPEDIPLLLEELKGDIDIVYSVMEEAPNGLVSEITSRLYHYCFSRLVNVNVPKNIGTFRAFSRAALNAVLNYQEQGGLYGPLMFVIGFKHAMVKVERDSRPRGTTSYTFKKRLGLAVDSLITYTDLPYKIFCWVGALVLLGATSYSFLVFMQYMLFGRVLPEGLTLVFLYLSVMTGSMLLCMGILGIYLYRIFQEVLMRPHYIIDKVVEAREAGADNGCS